GFGRKIGLGEESKELAVAQRSQRGGRGTRLRIEQEDVGNDALSESIHGGQQKLQRLLIFGAGAYHFIDVGQTRRRGRSLRCVAGASRGKPCYRQFLDLEIDAGGPGPVIQIRVIGLTGGRRSLAHLRLELRHQGKNRLDARGKLG